MIAYTDTSFQIDEDVAIPQEFDEDGVILDPSASNVVTDFPNGLRKFAVSTFAAAGTINANHKVGKIYIKPGSITLNTGEVAIPTRFKGEGKDSVYFTFNAPVLVGGMRFENLMITGSYTDTGGNYGSIFEDCYVISGFQFGERFHLRKCQIGGTINVKEKFTAIECTPSKYANSEVIVTKSGGGSVENFLIAKCSGNWRFSNFNAATNSVAIVEHSGRITIDATVTYTAFKIYGACEVVNNGGTGVTVDFIPFSEALDPADVWTAATRSLTDPVDLIDSLKHKAGSSGYDRTTDSLEAIGEQLADGARDFSDAEVEQVRDALGITGTKATATGGQLQNKLNKLDMVDYQNRTVVTRQSGNPKTYKMGTGANEKMVTVDYVDVGGGDLRADKETVS